MDQSIKIFILFYKNAINGRYALNIGVKKYWGKK